MHYEPYALWGVPEYVSDKLVSVEDLCKPEILDKMVMMIQGIGLGAGITRFSMEMMKQYGLENAGYRFYRGTQEECIAVFEGAVKEKKWVVVPLWHPQFLHDIYKIRELKDPKGLLGGRDRAVLLANTEHLHALFSKEEIVVLDNIKMTNAIISHLDYQINRDDKTPYQAAKEWFDNTAECQQWFKQFQGESK
ncbi:MAG: glycine betaine ABC transporter substrate-binding protein [Sulfurovum sp.]|nr:glycine betaine ABC transporter substrate-binding protein [Sulfurovum sp.]MCB4762113.1 glycine betaine ABC transporter substrate-binding protein [Sulfurovum sp.]MCB4781041.1 glycine betaine ABC transporter substrate-binding protein [Sulfurovum sp.]